MSTMQPGFDPLRPITYGAIIVFCYSFWRCVWELAQRGMAE